MKPCPVDQMAGTKWYTRCRINVGTKSLEGVFVTGTDGTHVVVCQQLGGWSLILSTN